MAPGFERGGWPCEQAVAASPAGRREADGNGLNGRSVDAVVEVRRRGDGTRALRDRVGAWRAIGRSAVRLGRGARAAWLIRGLVLPALLLAATLPAGAAGPPLVLERIITLADVRGRI